MPVAVGVAAPSVCEGALVAVDRLLEVGSADVVGAVVSSSSVALLRVGDGAGVVVSSSSPAVVRGALVVGAGAEVSGSSVGTGPDGASEVGVGVGVGVRASWEERTRTSPYSVGTVT